MNKDDVRIDFSIVETCKDIHYHNAYQIIFVLSGEMQAEISSKIYNVKEGNILFINNLQMHSIRVLSFPYKRYIITIPASCSWDILNDRKLMSVFFQKDPIFSHTPEITQVMANLFNDMLQEQKCDNEYSSDMFQLLLKQILIMIYRQNKHVFSATAVDNNSLVWNAKKYIQDNCKQNLSIAEVADLFFISPSHLSHSFKKVIGCNPKKYLQLCRLAHAREMLCRTDKTVTEIYSLAGFSDINNFIRFFKQETGYTPTEYRKIFSHK